VLLELLEDGCIAKRIKLMFSCFLVASLVLCMGYLGHGGAHGVSNLGGLYEADTLQEAFLWLEASIMIRCLRTSPLAGKYTSLDPSYVVFLYVVSCYPTVDVVTMAHHGSHV
jgi:hypothetical protein